MGEGRGGRGPQQQRQEEGEQQQQQWEEEEPAARANTHYVPWEEGGNGGTFNQVMVLVH